MKTTTCINNYINGNLTDAKRQAKSLSHLQLFSALEDNYGKGWEAAFAIMLYLKGKGTFQSACDAEAKDKKAI